MFFVQCSTTSFGHTINVNLLLITRDAKIADNVFHAPVPEKFPKFKSFLILYVQYDCIKNGVIGSFVFGFLKEYIENSKNEDREKFIQFKNLILKNLAELMLRKK